MYARVGDRIVVAGHHTGGPNRDCEVLEVRGTNGGPPYLVRWEDGGHEALFFPGSNASVEQHDNHRTPMSQVGKTSTAAPVS